MTILIWILGALFTMGYMEEKYPNTEDDEWRCLFFWPHILGKQLAQYVKHGI